MSSQTASNRDECKPSVQFVFEFNSTGAVSMTSDIDDIVQRNSLRRDAGLPCLDVAAELKKLEIIRFEAAFEREIEGIARG